MSADIPPRQVGSELKDVRLSGGLMPFQGKGPTAQPHFLSVPGSDSLYLPVFNDEEQLHYMMKKVDIKDYTIKKIDDGNEFLESIPKHIKVAVNFREHEGKIRWTEVQR